MRHCRRQSANVDYPGVVPPPPQRGRSGSSAAAPRALCGGTVRRRRCEGAAGAASVGSHKWYHMSVGEPTGPSQRRAAPRRLRCPPARGRTASAEASRRPGEVCGIRELRWVWERDGSLKMMYGSDRAAQWRRDLVHVFVSFAGSRPIQSRLPARARRLWDLAAFTRVGAKF